MASDVRHDIVVRDSVAQISGDDWEILHCSVRTPRRHPVRQKKRRMCHCSLIARVPGSHTAAPCALPKHGGTDLIYRTPHRGQTCCTGLAGRNECPFEEYGYANTRLPSQDRLGRTDPLFVAETAPDQGFCMESTLRAPGTAGSRKHAAARQQDPSPPTTRREARLIRQLERIDIGKADIGPDQTGRGCSLADPIEKPSTGELGARVDGLQRDPRRSPRTVTHSRTGGPPPCTAVTPAGIWPQPASPHGIEFNGYNRGS